jgi:hypothetical protein
MKHPLATLAVFLTGCLTALAAPGCASGGPAGHRDFSREVNQLRPGTPQSVVRDRLGGPEREERGTVPALPPPRGAEAVLYSYGVRAGTPFKHWFYSRGDTHYHVYLVPTITGRDEWEVLAVRANDADASP